MGRAVVESVNGLLVQLFDVVFWPFRSADPIWALIVVSALTGVSMLWMFGRVSDQRAIRDVRERIRGNILGVRLYRHDVGVVARLQIAILRDIVTYVRYAILPTLVLLVPVVLILAQLNLRFESSPLPPDHPAVVKVTLEDGSSFESSITLDAPAGIVVETPAVHVPSRREVAWRIRGTSPGSYALVIGVDGKALEKALTVGEDWGAISGLRARSLVTGLLYPGELLLPPDDGIASIEVSYPALQLSVFDWPVHWLVVFLVVALATGFACKGMMGVEV